MHPIVHQVLATGVVPAAVGAAAALLLARRLSAALPLVIAAGLFAAWWGILGRPSLPPRSSQAWIPWFILGAAVVESVVMACRPRWVHRAALALLAGAGFAVLLRAGWGGASREVPWLLSFAVAFFYAGSWLALGRRLGPFEGVGAVAVAGGFASATLGLAGSATLSQLAGAVAATTGAAAFVAWVRRAPGPVPLAGATLALALLATGMNGHVYAELKAPSAMLLLVSPLAALLLPRLVPTLVPFPRALLTWSTLATLGAVATFLAWKASPPLEF